MFEVGAVLGDLDDVHADLAGVVLAAIDEPTVVELRLRRQPIGRFGALSQVDHNHAVVVSCRPMPMDEGLTTNPAVTSHLPAVEGTLQPVPLDPSVGEVRTQVRAKGIHGRDPAAGPTPKQRDLRAHALNVLDLLRA